VLTASDTSAHCPCVFSFSARVPKDKTSHGQGISEDGAGVTLDGAGVSLDGAGGRRN